MDRQRTYRGIGLFKTDDERIKNANNSFAVTDQQPFEHVLVIDDAIGSGATMNELVGKFKGKICSPEIYRSDGQRQLQGI